MKRMRPPRLTKNVILLVTALAALLVFIVLSLRVYTIFCSNVSLDCGQVLALAERKAAEMGYSTAGYRARLTQEHDKRLLYHIQSHFKGQERSDALRSVPAYYWQVLWQRPKVKSAITVDSEHPAPNSADGMVMSLDLSGQVTGFRLIGGQAGRSAAGPAAGDAELSEAAAAALADSVLHRVWKGEPPTMPVLRVSRAVSDSLTSYGFLYTLPNHRIGIGMRFRVEIQGSWVKKWEHVYETDSVLPEQGKGLESVRVIGFLLLLGFYAVFFIKRLRNDLIDFRQAAPVAVLTFLTTLVMMLGIPWGSSWEDWIFPVVAVSLLLPLAIWVAYSCADSLIREVWEDKLWTLDALYKGFFFHRRFGQSVLAGMGAGTVFLGAVTGTLYLAAEWGSVDLIPWSLEFNSLSAWNPLLHSLSRIANDTLWLQFGVMLFILGLLAHYFSKPVWIIVGSGLAWAIALNSLLDLPGSPLWLTMVLAGLFGAVQAGLFVHWDFLASIVAQAFWMSGITLLHLILLDHPTFYWSIAGLSAIWLAVLVFAILALQRPVTDEALKRFLPVQAFKIVERMRLRRELEIARDVQSNFLPKQNPQVKGLEVASLCWPALEVAGDYYDFLPLDDQHLGVAIGDVSGKGISAAFYMTLTKGFLRSLTRTVDPPAKVMSEINRLFWENVDRNHFISMIYGVFDTQARTLTFVRAGHNPIFHLRQQTCTALTPGGLALGLERGELFDRILEEKTVPLQPGDLLAFYTDGFPEARNHRQEEFGEERLAQVLRENDGASAEQLLSVIKKQMQAFIGRGLQHDDMTMVLVRITE